MGARGPTPKPDRKGSRIVQRTKAPELALVGELDVPNPPAGLLHGTRGWWRAYWASDVARAVQADTDVPALSRLAMLYDERVRAMRGFRKSGRVVAGSQGQPVMHPLGRYLKDLDQEIRMLEDRFGLNPRARLSLGLQLTQARRSLEDLYRDLDEDPDEPKVKVVKVAKAGGELAGS